MKFEDGRGFDFEFNLSASHHDEKGGARAMKPLPEDLLVGDNPADVGLAQEALAGGRHQSRISYPANGEQTMSFPRRAGQYAAAVGRDLVILDLDLPKKGGGRGLDKS